MASRAPMPGRIRFDAFELDATSGELRKDGILLKLQPQPFRVLVLLIERSGQVVTREEIQRYLWTDSTFVDFEHGINFSINQIRGALSDSAEKPRYIETLPRRGYRFIGTVDTGGAKAPEPRKVWERVSPAAEFLDSIAVLPFENAGGEQDMEYLSDGITASIISNLSQLHKLRVVPRTTMFRYKGKAIDVPQVGRELRVRVVLTGQVAHRGEILIVNTELIDTIHDSQLWGANYHRRFEDIFSVQAEIAGEITNRLRLRLNDEERKQLARRPTENRDAYHLYLKAVYWANKWTEEGVRKGVDYIKQAIDADPVYAEAWTALAYLYVLIGFFGGAPLTEIFIRAKAAALKALEIDDGQADAHAALAFVRLVYDWDWQGAEVELLRAIELGPNLAEGHYVYSHWYLTQKLYAEAIAEANLALDIDPLSVHFNYHLGAIHYFSRHYDQAIERLHKTIELDPRFTHAHQLLAMAYARKGIQNDAIAEGGKGLELANNDLRGKAFWGMVSALMGKPVEARKVLAELTRESGPPNFSFAYQCALLHALLGDPDEAFTCLDEARQGHAVTLAYVATTPELESLRDDPRFSAVLRSVGIPVSSISSCARF